MSAARKCGTCSACCHWPAVEEIDKPARTRCKYLYKQGFGCTIYEGRPSACAEYKCSWLRGMGAQKDRPGTSGVMIDRRSTQFGVVLVAHQLEPGSAMKPKGMRAIKHTTRDEGLPCLVVGYEDIERVVGVAGSDDFIKEVERRTVDGVVRLGGTAEWAENIVDRMTRGMDDGR